MHYNLILDTDSYKFSHWLQFPTGTTKMYSYFESRGGEYEKTIFFGLQYFLKEYLSQPISIADVIEAEKFAKSHGEPFNREGWEYIVREHEGRLPVRIRAVPEGTVLPTHNILLDVESTDPKAFWVVTWLETIISRMWYPITVATQSYYIKKLIKSFLDKTSDNADMEINFKLHDFGSRGVSSPESAGIGGMAHLVNFLGSDTVQGVRFANHYYHCEMAGFSIPAAEHSTITSWGKDHEEDAFRNMLKQFAKPGALVAVVSDSYDIYNAAENLWGDKLREEVVNSGATVIIRPDSGNPPEVVSKLLQILGERFGWKLNSKGFKVLNNVRVIQGDGINRHSILDILTAVEKIGYSTENVAFGMGGALLQQVNRDTNKFAFKCSYIEGPNGPVNVFKSPVTDPGKKSKAGRLDLVKRNGEFITVPYGATDTILRTVFENGQLYNETTLQVIRVLATQ